MLLSGPPVAADRHDNMSAYADKGVAVLLTVSRTENMLVNPITEECYCSVPWMIYRC